MKFGEISRVKALAISVKTGYTISAGANERARTHPHQRRRLP